MCFWERLSAIPLLATRCSARTNSKNPAGGLESLSVEQLEEYACLGVLPDPLPDFLPRGKSALDGLDRKRLRQLWEENTRRYVGRKGRTDFLLLSRSLAGAGMCRPALLQTQLRRTF